MGKSAPALAGSAYRPSPKARRGPPSSEGGPSALSGLGRVYELQLELDHEELDQDEELHEEELHDELDQEEELQEEELHEELDQEDDDHDELDQEDELQDELDQEELDQLESAVTCAFQASAAKTRSPAGSVATNA